MCRLAGIDHTHDIFITAEQRRIECIRFCQRQAHSIAAPAADFTIVMHTGVIETGGDGAGCDQIVWYIGLAIFIATPATHLATGDGASVMIAAGERRDIAQIRRHF